MPLTAVPQRTALSHAFGGLAAGLVGTAKYLLCGSATGELTTFRTGAIGAEVLLGFLTFTGSLMAAGKLQESASPRGRSRTAARTSSTSRCSPSRSLAGVVPGRRSRRSWPLFPVVVALSLLFGVLLIIPIGGADMPTVISLLNSYAGLSAVAMGFVLENKLLIIAGALDGSSGLILSIIMCRAMNRSFTNVLFGAFGQVQAARRRREQRTANAAPPPQDAAQLLEQAQPRGDRPGLRHGGRAGAAPRARALRPARPSAASTCASRSTRWPAACPAT